MTGSGDPSTGSSLKSLYLCYFPLTEPLVQTQVLPYLRGLAAAGHDIHLLTYEVRKHRRDERLRIRERLAETGITWHSLRYHKRPSLPATAFDVASGVIVGTYLTRRHHIDLLHARTHVPATMAICIRRLARAGLLFDVRGLMAEEYVDAGTWVEGNLAYRLIKNIERRCLHEADGVVVLTDRARRHLFGDRWTTDSGAPIAVIPSTVDLRAVRSHRDRRDDVRARLGVQGCKVMIYVGKFSTWYMAREMAKYFKHELNRDDRSRFLVLTQSEPALITADLTAVGVPEATYVVTFVPPEEVGGYLAAADYGISFIKAAPSKIASSPTKVAEYLAAGLPVVVSGGVGDTDQLIRDEEVGVVLEEHTEAAYETAGREIDRLLADPETPGRCIESAAKSLSLENVGIPRYRNLYQQISVRIKNSP